MTAASGARDFLFEIGCEELPAAAAASAAAQAGALAREAFAAHHVAVDGEQVSVWVTPRRIAVYVAGLAAMQEAQETAERGPLAASAFAEDGAPTKAAEGFARAKGVAVGELEVREHGGQRFVFAVHRREGRPTVEALPDICRHILRGISFPKTMRWDGADMRFSRPVRWLVTKYGEETIEFDVDGVTSGGVTRGHRFLSSSQEIEIGSAAEYRELLAGARVIVDQEERRRVILEQLATGSARLGARFIDPAGELEEVLYLVENPTVLSGCFSEGHLRLPARVLVTAMQAHQRYFPLTEEDGSLKADFLFVMNGDPAAAEGIIEGNERVLEGRIEDAEFSFDKDMDTGIEAMHDALGEVVFHRRLGSLADKTARLQSLVDAFADLLELRASDRKAAASAARLAKADQVSVMVQEFPTLEGYIGSVYAEMEGFPVDITSAVAEQYLPTAAGGGLPGTVPGAVLSVCDKVDNIMAAFSVDELPTGSRDPYGLRRAAVGLAEIAGRFDLDFDLVELLLRAHELYLGQKADVIRDSGLAMAAYEFVCDRIQNRLVERGVPVELVEAARAAGSRGTLRLMALVEALDAFRRLPEFEDLHTAYFRSTKIAAKAGVEVEPGAVDENLLTEPAEHDLYKALLDLGPEVGGLIQARDYRAALAAAAKIRGPIDRFFDDVLVMAKDEAVRNNRLALVLGVAAVLRQLGDPMRVAAAPPPEGIA